MALLVLTGSLIYILSASGHGDSSIGLFQGLAHFRLVWHGLVGTTGLSFMWSLVL